MLDRRTTTRSSGSQPGRGQPGDPRGGTFLPYDSAGGPLSREPGGIAHETGELHRLLVESVRDYAIFALDPQGYVLSWNAGAQRLKGYTSREIIGKHFSTFYPPEKVAEKFPEYELEMAARLGQFEDEGWRVRKGGSLFWASVLITAIRQEDGTLVGFAKVTRDLTDRREAQAREIEVARKAAAEEAARHAAEARELELRELADKLRRQAAELESANHAKTQFLASMSHELRTPLNAIGGYVDLLSMELRGPLTPEQRQDLERVRRSQQHLLGIINDILNFSRIEAGQLTYELAPVPLHEVVDSVSMMVAPQVQSKGLHFETTGCPPDVVAWADRAKVEQILLNLLSNSVKFTDKGGALTLTCEPLGNNVALAVRDTGVGIPPEQFDAIFEPFIQVGRTLTASTEGTGLGLAISRDLARAMGGDITVESTAGAGSTFTVTLPGKR
jgi:PAS domain S-box-containing protein